MSHRMRIGDLVHGLLVDEEAAWCAPGWVVAWRDDPGLATLQGFGRPMMDEAGTGLPLGLWHADDVAHDVPDAGFRGHGGRSGEGGDAVAEIASFHRPDECPWER